MTCKENKNNKRSEICVKNGIGRYTQTKLVNRVVNMYLPVMFVGKPKVKIVSEHSFFFFIVFNYVLHCFNVHEPSGKSNAGKNCERVKCMLSTRVGGTYVILANLSIFSTE